MTNQPTQREEKYLKDKLDTILAILGAVYTNGFFDSKLTGKVHTEFRDMQFEEIKKIINQIIKYVRK